MSAHFLCGCEFTFLKHKLQRGEALKRLTPRYPCCVSAGSRTFPLAAVSYFLTVARKLLGGPERIDGFEMNNRRLSNEEKAPLIHTCTEGKWKRAGDAFFTGLTSRQIVGLKRFHIQFFSLTFPMKIFSCTFNILLVRVLRISTTISVCLPYSGKANWDKKL